MNRTPRHVPAAHDGTVGAPGRPPAAVVVSAPAGSARGPGRDGIFAHAAGRSVRPGGPDRLSALDAAFLYIEGPTTPMNVGGLAIFDPGPVPFDRARFQATITDRLWLVPRYRQVVRRAPARVAGPVWVDDVDFDVTRHVAVRELAGASEDVLLALTAQLLAQQLDRDRPLWRIEVVTGLPGRRIAMILVTHHALADGISAMGIAQLILDADRVPGGSRDWTPQGRPAAAGLLAAAARDVARRPVAALAGTRAAANDLPGTARRAAATLSGLVSTARVTRRSAPVSPLNAVLGATRRFAVARTDLEDYRRIRAAIGATVNDVVLAVAAGAVRHWLVARGEPMPPSATVRALVPRNMRPRTGSEPGNRVSAYFVELPVGEPDPMRRLLAIHAAMDRNKSSGQEAGAATLFALSGLSPPSVQSISARTVNRFSRRLFNVAISNVPGPAGALFSQQHRLAEVFPVVPLAGGQALSVGVTSYDGAIYYGLNADADAIPDVADLARAVPAALAELAAVQRRG